MAQLVGTNSIDCYPQVMMTEVVSHPTTIKLDQMKRKKASQNLDSRQIMLLENAYFQVSVLLFWD
jgi:hypothetical protein